VHHSLVFVFIHYRYIWLCTEQVDVEATLVFWQYVVQISAVLLAVLTEIFCSFSKFMQPEFLLKICNLFLFY
jgi:hypothetical protein